MAPPGKLLILNDVGTGRANEWRWRVMLSKRQHRTTACSIAALVLVGISWRGGAQAQAPAPVDFLPPVMFDSGDAGPADIDRGDFNGDGLTDVAVLTTSGGGRVHVLLGDGAGGLLLDTSLGVAYATGIAGADFNADGIVDLAVTQQSNKPAADPYCGLMPGTVIFLGAGGAAPAYAFKTCLPGVSTSHYFTDAAAGDFNGDGIIDLAVADDAVYSVRVYRGVGDGTFLAPVRATNSSGVRVFGPLFVLDVNHDGHLDLMASTVGGVGVYLGNGTGALSFSSVAFGSSQLLLHNGVRTFAPGDINNDGHVDLVGVERGTLPATPTLQQNFFVASTGTVAGLTYVSTDTQPFPELNVGSAVLADFNKDGTLDAAVVHRDGNAVRLFLGRGNGTFAAGAAFAVGVEPRFATAADLNGDNWTDLAVIDRNLGNQSRTWVLEQLPGAGDATPPTVAVTAPAPGSSVAGIVDVEAMADDASGIARVEFFRGSVPLGSDSTPPYSVAWDTTPVPNGAYVLTAVAFDVFDNRGTSAGVPVTVANPDVMPPVVTLTAPAPGSLLGGVVLLSAAASDANGIARVEFYRGATLIGSDTTPNPFELAWNTVGIVAGLYALSAKAYDPAGNSATSPAVPVTIDQPPAAQAGAPQTVEATSAAGAVVTLNGAGSDPDAGDPLTFEWTELGQPLGNGASISVQLPIGMHAATLRVTDSFGAFAEDTVSIDVVDSVPPVLVVPPNQTVEATSADGAMVTFSASAQDAVEGAVPVTCVPPSGSSFAFGITTVTCAAADSAGNTSRGSFTVTVTPPAPPPGPLLVGLGDSFVQGVQSGDANEATQPYSFLNLMAWRMGAGLPLPLVRSSWYGAAGSTNGRARVDPAVRSLNLAVSGADVNAVLTDAATALDPSQIDTETELVLYPEVGTQLAVAERLHPQYVVCWVGNNDVLDSVLAFDRLDATQLTPVADFTVRFTQLVERLDAIGAKAAFGTIPDITALGFLLNRQDLVRLLGTDYGMPDGSLTAVPTMALLGLGLANGSILSDPSFVLDPSEQQIIRAHVAELNQVIRSTVLAHGMALVDTALVFDYLAANGLNFFGVPLNTRFLGGLLSLDGVHPSNFTHGLAAFFFIDALNQHYGAGIPQIDAEALFWLHQTDPFIDKDGDGRVTGRVGLGLLETLFALMGVSGDPDDTSPGAAPAAASASPPAGAMTPRTSTAAVRTRVLDEYARRSGKDLRTMSVQERVAAMHELFRTSRLSS